MKVYLAEIQECDWETERETVGIYSTREYAEEALLNEINYLYHYHHADAFLSLEAYDKWCEETPEPEEEIKTVYEWFVSEYELDK